MSRQAPYFVIDSEEEPMEDTSDDAAVSAHDSTSVHNRVTSDDTSDAYVVPPPTAPVVTPVTAPTDPTTRMLGSTFMETRHMTAGPSRGPVLRRTPRMCVRDFPTGPLAPRDKAPMDESTEPSLRVPRLAHLEWMTPLLGRWRSLEGIPSTFETGESSRSPAPLPTTGEPVELTLPTLISVIRTLFRLSGSRGIHMSELQSDISRLDGEMIYMQEHCHFLLGNIVAAREIAETARARVRLLEARARMTVFTVGIFVLMAVLLTAVGWFLPYFH